jgi:hypothetical protein
LGGVIEFTMPFLSLTVVRTCHVLAIMLHVSIDGMNDLLLDIFSRSEKLHRQIAVCYTVEKTLSVGLPMIPTNSKHTKRF